MYPDSHPAAPLIQQRLFCYEQVKQIPELTRSAVLEGMPPEDLMASMSLWGCTDSAASRNLSLVLS